MLKGDVNTDEVGDELSLEVYEESPQIQAVGK